VQTRPHFTRVEIAIIAFAGCRIEVMGITECFHERLRNESKTPLACVRIAMLVQRDRVRAIVEPAVVFSSANAPAPQATQARGTAPPALITRSPSRQKLVRAKLYRMRLAAAVEEVQSNLPMPPFTFEVEILLDRSMCQHTKEEAMTSHDNSRSAGFSLIFQVTV
jgi:hypothetical protein